MTWPSSLARPAQRTRDHRRLVPNSQPLRTITMVSNNCHHRTGDHVVTGIKKQKTILAYTGEASLEKTNSSLLNQTILQIRLSTDTLSRPCLCNIAEMYLNALHENTIEYRQGSSMIRNYSDMVTNSILIRLRQTRGATRLLWIDIDFTVDFRREHCVWNACCIEN